MRYPFGNSYKGYAPRAALAISRSPSTEMRSTLRGSLFKHPESAAEASERSKSTERSRTVCFLSWEISFLDKREVDPLPIAGLHHKSGKQKMQGAFACGLAKRPQSPPWCGVHIIPTPAFLQHVTVREPRQARVKPPKRCSDQSALLREA